MAVESTPSPPIREAEVAAEPTAFELPSIAAAALTLVLMPGGDH